MIACGDTTIETQTDADGISSCSTVDGDITIKADYSGALDFGSVKKITGNVMCTGGENVTSITGSSLESIGKNFTLSGLTKLTTLSFADLTSIGSIYFTALPELESFDFATGVNSVDDINIVNTGLTSLSGITLDTVGQLVIEDNNDMATINLNNLTNATGNIIFSGNDNELSVSLPKLQGGTSMTFTNISSVDIPSLETLTGQLGFWASPFTALYAPKLTETGDLVFTNNAKLYNISMPKLQTVDGGFSVTKNNKLQVIDLPALETVKGAINFIGGFYEVEFGSLKTVDGAFTIESTNGTFSCDEFKSSYKSDVRGSWKCNAAESSLAAESTGTGSSSSSSSTGSSTSNPAMMNTASGSVAGIAAIFYALAQLV